MVSCETNRFFALEATERQRMFARQSENQVHLLAKKHDTLQPVTVFFELLQKIIVLFSTRLVRY